MNEVEKFKAQRAKQNDSTKWQQGQAVTAHRPISLPSDQSVGPKYYEGGNRTQERPKLKPATREEMAKKTWIHQYVEPRPDMQGSVDWDTYVPEDQVYLRDQISPIRVIKRDLDPAKNDTTYHSSRDQYNKVFRMLDYNPNYRNSEVFKNSQQLYKQQYELRKSIWEEQQAAKEQ